MQVASSLLYSNWDAQSIIVCAFFACHQRVIPSKGRVKTMKKWGIWRVIIGYLTRIRHATASKLLLKIKDIQ